jgi:RNA polymerase sigma factor (sigma-70 family)
VRPKRDLVDLFLPLVFDPGVDHVLGEDPRYVFQGENHFCVQPIPARLAYTSCGRVIDGHSEQELIQKAKAGDNVAYEQLLRPNLTPATRLAHTLLGSSNEAEDAVQEAAVKGWRKLRNLRSGAPFQPWFLGIVVRQVRTIQRAPWWTLIRLPELPVQAVAADEAWMEGEDLQRAIGNLPRLQREVVLLHFYLDLSIQDSAASLGLSVPGVKSRINRALRRLRSDIATSEVPAS